MKIIIYQTDLEYSKQFIPYLGWSHLLSQDFKHVPAILYQQVYSYEAEKETFEQIFTRFNVNHPVGYTGRSMSVSDVIEIKEADKDSQYYFCDTFGFVRVPFDRYMVGKAEKFTRFMDNEQLCEKLITTIEHQICSDNEAYSKKGRKLLEACIKGNVEGVLISLTGWNLSSLMQLSSNNDTGV